MLEAGSGTNIKQGAEKKSITQIKALWREYSEKLRLQEVQPSVSIGVAASFTANSLLPFLGASLVEANLNPSLELGPYNQLFQVCLDHKSIFKTKCDTIILLYRLEDIVLTELLAFLHGDAGAFQGAVAKIDMLVSALKGLRESFRSEEHTSELQSPC